MSTPDDLLRQLRAHPEWRAELRRELLTDEVLQLPATVASLAQAQTRTEARLEELALAQARTEARLVELAQAQARTEARLESLAARVEELVQAQRDAEARLEGIDARLADLALKIAELSQNVTKLSEDLRKTAWRTDRALGWVVEFRYRERPWSFFGTLARRIRLLPIDELDDLLDAAVAEELLTDYETEELRRADGVLRGRRDGADVYLVLEASSVVDESDVRRASQRAALLARTRRNVQPVVAGERITQDAEELAAHTGVLQVIDGSIEASPGEAA